MSEDNLKISITLPTIFMDRAKERAERLNFLDVKDYIQALAIRHLYIDREKFEETIDRLLSKRKYNLSTLLQPQSPAILLDKLPSTYIWTMTSIGIIRRYSYKLIFDKDILDQIDKEAFKWRVSTSNYISFLLLKDLGNLTAYKFYRSYFDPIWCARIMEDDIPLESRQIPMMFKTQFKIKDNIPKLSPGWPYKETKYDNFLEFLEPESELINVIADNFFK